MKLRLNWSSLILAGFLFLPLHHLSGHLDWMGPVDEHHHHTHASGFNRPNHEASHGIVERAEAKIRAARNQLIAERDGLILPMRQLPNSWRGTPSTGNVPVLVFLFDFADTRANADFPELTRERIDANLFGAGTSEAQNYLPRDSLRNYYLRASNTRLNVTGETLGWYNFSGNQEDYRRLDESNSRSLNWSMAQELLLHYDSQINYADYDVDGDGFVDALNFIWSGERGPWSSFWWGYRWTFAGLSDDFVLDGVRFADFSWQWVETRPDQPEEETQDYDPRIIIHEFGHLLGLPDLYDYEPEVGPEGGAGGASVMDSSRGGNMNYFFRWLLGWVDPETILVGEETTLTLTPSGEPGATGTGALVFFEESIIPDPFASEPTLSPFSELLVIEYRTPSGNDANVEALGDGGVMVWHVDAASDGSDFLQDNSDTSHKLMRVVQADGLESIENEVASFAPEHLFQAGMRLGPESPARNGAYGLAPSRFVMEVESIENNEATIRLSSYNGPLLQVSPGYVQAQQPPGLPHPPLEFTLHNSGASQSVTVSKPGFLGDIVDAATEGATESTDMEIPGGQTAHTLPLTTTDLPLHVSRETLLITADDPTVPPVHVPVQNRVRIPLYDALDDYMIYDLSTGRHRPWFGQSDVVHTGTSAAQTGAVDDSRQTFMRGIVLSPAIVNFHWKVSSEADRDRLQFQVDGVVVEEISGEQDWTEVSVPLLPGEFARKWTTISWIYIKDEANSVGEDAGWVDDVHIERQYMDSVTDWMNSYRSGGSISDLRHTGDTWLEAFMWFFYDRSLNTHSPSVLLNPLGNETTDSIYLVGAPWNINSYLQGSNDLINWYTIENGDLGYDFVEIPDSEVFPPMSESWSAQRIDVPEPAPFLFYRRVFALNQ